MTKTVLITGATSGFGLATAKRFIQADWQVIATGRRVERLAALQAELGDEQLAILAFDMQNNQAIETAIANLPEKFQAIDVLINNAGLALGTAPAPQTNLADWHTMIETNISGLVSITHHLLPRLIQQKGLIVNLSSIAATYPYPGGNVYAATKAFVTQFSLGLRSDLHGTGVRVTSLEPGMAETEFTLVRTQGDQTKSDNLYADMQPLTPQNIAETIYWLAIQPPHININRLEIMPVNQSWSGFQIHRDQA